MSTQTELERRNERLQLLLHLTNKITSNLDLRDVLCAVLGNIRAVIHGDLVSVSLLDTSTGKFRVYALDFPQGQGILREGLLITPIESTQKAIESLQPVVINSTDSQVFPSEVHGELALVDHTRSICFLPLANRGRAVGVLVIGRTTEVPFAEDEIGFLGQVAGQIAIAIENALAYEEISRLKDKLAQERLYLEEEIRSEMGFEEIIGNSPALRNVLELVETVAPSDSTVLLLGETGTGKELVARAIHERSRRKETTFVKLNCAAIPTGLLESELFGHEKGAFTGAISQKIGRMELADQGTLFLDEVGDIPLEIQPKLLRALQEREFERLGSTHTRRVNVRLVAATNQELEKMVADREFRSDLYYRLHVFPIRIPPLRERKEDIPLLVSYFVQKFTRQMQKRIDSVPASAMKALRDWDWPGNVRELENFIERAVILSRGRSLDAPLAELRRKNAESTPATGSRTRAALAATPADRVIVSDEYSRKQREEIVRALTLCGGRVGGADGAAAQLGINRTTLLSRMKKFGLYAKQFS
ncbi:MAG TPA: sigma 54-interacting transcriptional regulator [Terracidiphilus sp.]|nr:sigma 54-interacting transcriptional regulator [Terracidiphilus sp.]